MVYHDWFDDADGYTGWAIPFHLHQCDESVPWFGMDYEDALQNGFDFDAYGDVFFGLFNSSEKYDADERITIMFIYGDIKGGVHPNFNGRHMPTHSDIVEFETGFYYVGKTHISLFFPPRK